MKIDALYEIIRKEDVCLWVGSGFSMYAGYPSADELKHLLKDELKDANKQDLDVNLSLRQFTEDYIALYSRGDLIAALQRVFIKNPKSTKYHDLLALVPHFRSIITTNYDQLLEMCFKEKAVVVASDMDVPNALESTIKIYKIHGDIAKGESIVISESDYVNMHKRNFRDPLWASVIREISSKHILFFGYGYEDDNVKADFEHVYEKLGTTKKRRFMIGRSATELKLKKLKNRNIEHVVCDAGAFIEGFVKHLKAHIASDLRHSLITSDQAQQFIGGFEKQVILSSSNKGAEIVSVSKLNGESEHHTKLSIQNSETINGYKEFLSGYKQLKFTITADQLHELQYENEGFVLHTHETIEKVEIMHIPDQVGKCSIEFPVDADYLLRDIKYKLYNSIPGQTLIQLEIYGFKIEVRITNKAEGLQLDFGFTEPSCPTNIRDHLSILQALVWLLSGEEIRIIVDNGRTIDHRFTDVSKASEFKLYLDFYKRLREIEKFFKVKFPGIKIANASAKDQQLVGRLSTLIQYKYFVDREIKRQVTIDLPASDKIVNSVLEGVPADTYVIVERSNNSIVSLFGIQINLGTEQLSILQPSVHSHDKENRTAILIPKDDAVIYRYSAVGFEKLNDEQILWSISKSDDLETNPSIIVTI